MTRMARLRLPLIDALDLRPRRPFPWLPVTEGVYFDFDLSGPVTPLPPGSGPAERAERVFPRRRAV